MDFFKFWKHPPLPVERNTPISDIRYVVIDTELTGLNERKDSIISIGAVRMSGMRIELGNTFHRLVKPVAGFKPESVVIHGITPSDVRSQPGIKPILSEFLQFCGDDIIVGHCVSIDLRFLGREMKRSLGGSMQNTAIDTFRVYEWLCRKTAREGCFSAIPRDASLYAIAKCFGITVRGAHDALIDAYITAQLFQRFFPVLLDTGVQQIADLIEIGNPEKGGGAFKLTGEISNL